jgi:F0F1-type ATP synthase assembly protein I
VCVEAPGALGYGPPPFRPGGRNDRRSIRLISRKGAIAYQGAFEAVISILVGAGLGAWADHGFGTSPILLLVGLAVGFGAFVLRLVRLGHKLNAATEDDAEENEESKRP